MEQNYARNIQASANNTILYGENFSLLRANTATSKTYSGRLVPTDSVSAAFLYGQGKTAILNFASFKEPGGMFLSGSKAQEESLCHESFLYNVLSRRQGFYDGNRRYLQRGMYLDRALYSPDILFFHEGQERAFDVLTCAAPNISAGKKYCNVSDAENHEALSERIRFVLEIAADQEVDTLILGAFGCGVFKQDAREVAREFYGGINKIDWIPHLNVVFAVPKGKDGNFESFKQTLMKLGNSSR